MPVYTYECKNCGQRFDAKQSFSDDALTICPNCGGEVYRIIQPAAVVFKGSGFYVTDSKGKQNLATTNGKKDEAKSGEATEKTSTDSGGDKGSDKSDSGTATKSTDAPAKPAAETKSSSESK